MLFRPSLITTEMNIAKFINCSSVMQYNNLHYIFYKYIYNTYYLSSNITWLLKTIIQLYKHNFFFQEYLQSMIPGIIRFYINHTLSTP